MDYAKESLRLHSEWRGKLEVTPRAQVDSKEALSLASRPRKEETRSMRDGNSSSSFSQASIEG